MPVKYFVIMTDWYVCDHVCAICVARLRVARALQIPLVMTTQCQLDRSTLLHTASLITACATLRHTESNISLRHAAVCAMAENNGREYDYDLFTIGGGSGGVRGSRFSGTFGAKVGLAELPFAFESSETQGGLGGTCVLRGCVPKKLVMYCSEYRQYFKDAVGFGCAPRRRLTLHALGRRQLHASRFATCAHLCKIAAQLRVRHASGRCASASPPH
jgi:hypothetical protein